MFIKDYEHQRREENNAFYFPDILINCNTKVFHLEKEFLSNTGNKEQLIQILLNSLLNEGNIFIICNGDADTKIVHSAPGIICENKVAAVAAEDTAVLVILICFWKSEMADAISKQNQESINQ